MAESGANIIAVKEILGHADIKTTIKYFHPGDSLTEAVEKLAKFNSFGEPRGEHMGVES